MTSDGRRGDETHVGQSTQPPAGRSPATRHDEPSYLVRGDDRYHDDKQLVADLANLNTRVGRYVLERLNADAGRAPSMSPDDEHGLGMQLVRSGLAILDRADERRRAAKERQAANGTQQDSQ